MTAAEFPERFGHFVDAPDGIRRLRELVLQLAVRGKLVPQDSNEEPASNLLNAIASTRQRLVQTKDAAKLAFGDPPSMEDRYFAVPSSWAWARLDQVSKYIQRGKGPRYAEQSEIPVISQKCVQWSGFDVSRARFLDPSALEKYKEERLLQDDDILWNSTGTGTIGRVNIFKKDFVPFGTIVADSHVTVVRLLSIDPRFAWIWLASPFIQATIESDASGSTNQVELATSRVKWQPIPIPPLAEQHRIVAKVDELMALCDQMEAERNARDETHTRLIRAVHHPLTEASDAPSTATAWRRIRNHFADLYTTRESVQALRQTILQLAVQGKLVEQDPKDDSTVVALQGASLKRQKLIAEGKIKRHKVGSESGNEGVPWDLPVGWTWIHPDEVSAFESNALTIGPFGSNLLKSDYRQSGIPLVFVKDIRNEFSSPPKCYIDKAKASDLASHSAKPGDLLITKMGDPPGDTAIYPANRQAAVITADCVKWSLMDKLVVTRFFYFALRAPAIALQIVDITKGAAHQKISLKRFRGIWLPLPPLAEQHRIVAKVDELMALCDRLDAAITSRDDTASHYAEAVVAHLTTEQQNKETSSFPRRRESMAH